VNSAWRDIVRAWDRFWFTLVDPRPLALIRILVALIAGVSIAAKLSVAEVAFSDQGWLTSEMSRGMMHPAHWSVFHAIGEPLHVQLVLIAGLVACIPLALGWRPRVMAGLVFVVLQSLDVRNMMLTYGGDTMIRMMVFYLVCGPCGATWSLEARAGRGAEAIRVLPLRLIQIQLALIYFVSGVGKAFHPMWQDGEAFWWVASDPFVSRMAEWMSPSAFGLTKLATWMTLGWEVLFPFLLLSRNGRKVAIAMGILFHGTTVLLMDVHLFGVIMLVAYVSFWVPRDETSAADGEVGRTD
jgi:hypothetical protein